MELARKNRAAVVTHGFYLVKGRFEFFSARNFPEPRAKFSKPRFYSIPMSSATASANYAVAQLDTLDPTRCPCGWSRRAFADVEGAPASVHVVEILEDSRLHYHKQMTEIYVILEGEGHLELDGELVPVKPLTSIMIRPGCRHRAVGKLRLLNIPIPAFDPHDEWFD